jgi:formamidopyrimidine-DNA glycosylase
LPFFYCRYSAYPFILQAAFTVNHKSRPEYRQARSKISISGLAVKLYPVQITKVLIEILTLMPELPEVETTCRGIAPHIEGQTVKRVIIRQPRLRWPVPPALDQILAGLGIQSVSRRAKYLLFSTNAGTMLIHLGMSGSLRIMTIGQGAGKHDHIDFIFGDDTVLRFNDPRRFGAVLWTSSSVSEHPLLKNLGPEPLLPDFNGELLYALSRNRKAPVKSFIMDSHIVVGVGNIYANEALFMAGILPSRQAGNISLARYQRLADCIRMVLQHAIQQGGTTLRNFVNEAGNPGYFKQQLRVYGRAGLLCVDCQQLLKEIRLANRSTVFCSDCQR